MSDDTKRKLPYKTLGNRLKKLREKLQESLAEVSGAVEIEVSVLENYEHGESRPSEDILGLLISHFNIKEDEANSMWELAGYSREKLVNETNDLDDQNSAPAIVMPIDVRIAYTDMAHVSANQYGVIINFMQTAGPNTQPLIVSRVGMSKEHAQSIIDMLQKVLNQNTPKSLPAPSNENSKKEKKEK